jgi:hypothetical protein
MNSVIAFRPLLHQTEFLGSVTSKKPVPVKPGAVEASIKQKYV